MPKHSSPTVTCCPSASRCGEELTFASEQRSSSPWSWWCVAAGPGCRAGDSFEVGRFRWGGSHVVGDDEFGAVVGGGGRGVRTEVRGRLGADVDGADEQIHADGPVTGEDGTDVAVIEDGPSAAAVVSEPTALCTPRPERPMSTPAR